MNIHEYKYVKLRGKMAEARVMHDFAALANYRYELECVKQEMGVL